MTNHHPASLLLALLACISGTRTATAQIIHEDLKLLASDGHEYHRLGKSIAIEGDIVAVTAQSDFLDLTYGDAYIFSRSTGKEIAKLQPTDTDEIDRFGECIAIGSGVIAVGASCDDDNGVRTGSVSLFDASDGRFLTKIYPEDTDTHDYFGWSVAIGDGYLAVGKPGDDENGFIAGAVYLFDAQTGEQVYKLIADDGAREDQFGYAIAISNGVLAVGAPTEDDDVIEDTGSVYLFDIETRTQTAKLTANDGEAYDWFGSAVAVDGGIVAVGASDDDDFGPYTGSVYLFDAETGSQLHKLHSSDAGEAVLFGWSVAMQDGLVAIGARWVSNERQSPGRAYIFDARTGQEIHVLVASDYGTGQTLGYSIAIDDGYVAVGSVLDRDNGPAAGAAYIFALPDPCIADANHDGILSESDFSAWVAAFSSAAPECDQNSDGLCTPADFTAWIANFNAGCD